MTPSPIPTPRLSPQKNALRVEVASPRPQCPARPTCLMSLQETVTGRARYWGNHSPCPSICDCRSFPRDRRILAPTVLREDEDGNPWLMNRAEGGWAESGRRLRSWGDILRYQVTFGECTERDADGRFIRVYPLPAACKPQEPHTIPRLPQATTTL